MVVRDVIERLGGPAKVAAALGMRTNAVANWSLRGIVPARHHTRLWRMAQEAGLDWRPPGSEGLTLAPEPTAPRAAQAA